MQRIRKDSETLSSPGVSNAPRVRRESDRARNENLVADAGINSGQRNVTNQPVFREVKIKKLIDWI